METRRLRTLFRERERKRERGESTIFRAWGKSSGPHSPATEGELLRTSGSQRILEDLLSAHTIALHTLCRYNTLQRMVKLEETQERARGCRVACYTAAKVYRGQTRTSLSTPSVRLTDWRVRVCLET